MPSYLSYKRFMSVLDEDDDIVAWFTTRNGVHVPIKKGQTKEDAVNNFFNNRQNESKTITNENAWEDSSRHFNNNVARYALQEQQRRLLYSIPGEWSLDIPQMETTEEFENFRNSIRDKYKDTKEWESRGSISPLSLKEYFEKFEDDWNQTKGYVKTYSETEERFSPKSGENIDSEGNTFKNPERMKELLKDSKAVDANGNPVALYIGTREPVVGNKFDFKHRREDSVSKQRAIFATTKKEVAETYKEGSGELKKVYFNMKRPLVVDFEGSTFHNGGYREYNVTPYGETWPVTTIKRKSRFADADEAPVINKLVNYAKKNGYDGLIAKNIADWGTNKDWQNFDPYRTMWFHNDDYVVFDPEQIIVDE